MVIKESKTPILVVTWEGGGEFLEPSENCSLASKCHSSDSI